MKSAEIPSPLDHGALVKWVQTCGLVIIGLFEVSQYARSGGGLHLAVGGICLLSALLSALGMLSSRAQGGVLCCAISALFLDLAFYQIDFEDLVRAFEGLDYSFLIPTAVLLALSSAIRAYRWKWLLPAGTRTSFLSRFSALSIGLAANQVLPARTGELVRVYVFGRRTQLSKTMVFATVVLERIFDGLTVLLFLVLVVLMIGVNSPEIRYMGLAGAAFYAGAIGSLVVIYLQEPLLERMAQHLLPASISQKAAGLLRAFADGLSAIRSTRQLCVISALSVLCWIVVAASFWPVLSAFPFGVPVPLYSPFLLVAALGLGLMIPAAPAGIGVFQFACLLTLQIVFAPYRTDLPVDFAEQAAAFSLVAHISQVLPEVLLGAVCFVFEGLHWREVSVKM